MFFWFILFIILVTIYVGRNIVVVPQAKAYVVERLGTYHATWGAGLHLKTPFIERIVRKVSLKEQVVDFAPQPVITKDNVTMQIDTVVYMSFSDPKALTYGIENPMAAIENLTATTLRNIIGDLELDETLTSRDVINTRMCALLDEATDPWGIKIKRVELKNIIPPRDIQDTMEKQMRAERERREAILQAQGQKEAQITRAQGEHDAAVLKAKADKEAMILAAEAEKIAAIQKAEGEAEAIRQVQEATAAGLKMLKEVQADTAVIQLQSLDALRALADGNATKIIIPSDIQGLAGTLTALSETVVKE